MTRRVPIPAWKYHLGHAGIAAAIYLLLAPLGTVPALIAGTVVWPIGKKLLQWLIFGWVDMKDALGDFVQHQPIWAVWLWQTGHLGVDFLVMNVVLYFLTLKWQRP